MRKVIFESVAGIVVIIATGATFIILATASREICLIAVLAYLAIAVLYFVARFVFLKKNKSLATYFETIELAKDDEREVQITGKALRTAYHSAIYGLVIAMGSLLFIEAFTSQSGVMYIAAILLISLVLLVITISYCIRWVVEYKK